MSEEKKLKVCLTSLIMKLKLHYLLTHALSYVDLNFLIAKIVKGTVYIDTVFRRYEFVSV